jgi:hypothetical protein
LVERSRVLLLRCDSLRAKRVATWPLHFVSALAVRANGDLLDFLSQPGGSDDPHAPLTFLATKHFLHGSSLPDPLSWEVPS